MDKKTVAVIPVSGREALLTYTISRLSRQVGTVICMGHTASECEAVESEGGLFYSLPPHATLGIKWQDAVNIARDFDPDKILIMGSSSMISDNWIDVFSPYLKDHDMVGAAGIHYYHVERRELCYWSGYKGGRAIEPIGVGRLIRRSTLDALDWQIFAIGLNRGLDDSTMKRVQKIHGSVLNLRSHGCCSVRISSQKWNNTNSHDSMARRSKILKGHEIDEFFPELKTMEL